MNELKISKLPDRTPVKITITVNPDLAQALRDYAVEYERQYGAEESVMELIPFMLAAFIESDAGFKKARRDRGASAAVPIVSKRGRSNPDAPSQQSSD